MVKSAIYSVILRYLAILIQFMIVVALARNLSIELAGQYFAIFGVIAVTFTISGLGIPDGSVKAMSEARAKYQREYLHTLVIGTVSVSLLINLLLAFCIGTLVVIAMGLDHSSRIIIALWWFGYAGTFLFSQVLVGCGKSTLATFFAYSSINLFYVLTLLPAIIFFSHKGLENILMWAAISANLALVVSSICVYKQIFPKKTTNAIGPVYQEVWPLIILGSPMMVSRLMQASIPWMPVWMLVALNYNDQAALYAAASRLTVAVTSVVSALRFSMRSVLVSLNVSGKYREIIALNRRVSLIAAIPPMLGLILIWSYGEGLISILLGSEYSLAAPILAILMFGVLGEAFGGLSDEILKMTNRTQIVLRSLVVSISLQIFLGLVIIRFDATILAIATSCAFICQYVYQVLWLSFKTEIRIVHLKWNIWR